VRTHSQQSAFNLQHAHQWCIGIQFKYTTTLHTLRYIGTITRSHTE
jgi:hypothetical protein